MHSNSDSEFDELREEYVETSDVNSVYAGISSAETTPSIPTMDGSNENQWSSLHAAGRCKPCRFHASKSGCKSGQACSYCHLPHPKRPSLAKREQCKAVAQRTLKDSALRGPEDLKETIRLLSKRGMYMRSVIHGKVRDGEMVTSCIASEDGDDGDSVDGGYDGDGDAADDGDGSSERYP